jgi:hypothetical protein
LRDGVGGGAIAGDRHFPAEILRQHDAHLDEQRVGRADQGRVANSIS